MTNTNVEESELCENSPFVILFKENVRVKIIDVLLRHSFSKLDKENISELTGVSVEELQEHLEILEELDFIIVEEDMYYINNEDPVISSLTRTQLYLNDEKRKTLQDSI